MSIEDYIGIQNHIKILIQNGMEKLNIGIIGGEPTLEYKNLILFLRNVITLCNQYKVLFHFNMTTNGRLLSNKDILNKLIECHVYEYQITIDGPPKLHNENRPAKNCGNSFGETFKGLLNLKKHGCDELFVTIRTNHTVKSIKSNALNKHLNILSRHFSSDKRFAIYNYFASNFGLLENTSNFIKSQKRRNINGYLNNITAKKGLIVKSDFYQPCGRVCYAARKNSKIIMPSLSLRKCSSRGLNSQINKIGHITSNGEVKLNHNYKLWIKDYALNDIECLNCKVAPICHSKNCPFDIISQGTKKCPDVKYDNRFMINTLYSHNVI